MEVCALGIKTHSLSHIPSDALFERRYEFCLNAKPTRQLCIKEPHAKSHHKPDLFVPSLFLKKHIDVVDS